MEFLNWITSTFDTDSLTSLVQVWIWKISRASLVALLAWAALRFVQHRIIGAMARADFPDTTVREVIRIVLRWVIILLATYYAMLIIGVKTTAIVGIITGSALAIGLAVQGTLSNVAAGLMLLILRPISVGEYIVAAGHEGTVITLGIFYTTIDTIEKYRISIPNSALFGSAIVNYSRNPVMTGRLNIGIAYSADLDQARQILIDAGKDVQGVLQDPQTEVLVQDLGDSAVILEIRFSAKGEDIWAATRAYRQAAKVALDQAGIEIPFPQTTVHYRPTA